MGPSRERRDAAADERRQQAADNYVRAEKAAQKADKAERKAAEKKGGR